MRTLQPRWQFEEKAWIVCIMLPPVATSALLYGDWGPLLVDDTWFFNPRIHSCIQNRENTLKLVVCVSRMDLVQ